MEHQKLIDPMKGGRARTPSRPSPPPTLQSTVHGKGKPKPGATTEEQIPKLKLSTNHSISQHVRSSAPPQTAGFPTTPPPSNWRETHNSLVQANKFLLNCGPVLQKYNDFTFIVGHGRELFEAHRLFLATRSDVLEHLFDNESESSVGIPEVSSASFREFLHFIYTDEFISSDNITEVFHLACKFNVPLLKEKCSAQISSKTCLENCVDVYQTFGKKYDPNGLGKQALDFIISNFVQLLKSGEFLRFDFESLQEILTLDDLSAEEIEIFEAVIRWADKKCYLNGWPKTSVNRRKVLGPLVKVIRFPVMTASVFSSRVAPLQILSPEESTNILNYLNGTGKQKNAISVEPFNKTPRKIISKENGVRNRNNFPRRHF